MTAEDPYGNIDPNYKGTVGITSSDPLATVDDQLLTSSPSTSFNYTFTTNVDKGVYTFSAGTSAVLWTTGVQQIVATDIKTGSITGSAPVNVCAADTTTSLVAATTVGGEPITSGAGYLGNAENYDIDLPGAAGGPNLTNVGQSGSALHFNGTDNYVAIPDNGSLDAASFSVSLWARADVHDHETSGYNWLSNGWSGQLGQFYTAIGNSYLVYKLGSFFIEGEGGNVKTVVFGATIDGAW